MELSAWTKAKVRGFLSPSFTKRGSEFESALLNHYGVKSVDEISDPTVRMWFEFAASSLDRGHEAVRTITGVSSFFGARVIDVGCAYGGFLVAAKMAGASEVCGIDINPGLLAFAQMHLRDYGMTGRLLRHDITSSSTLGVLGGDYDVVLCNDVIEHVVDPEVCARSLSGLLARGGRLFLQVPNAQAADFLIKDGHYGLFGLTLLNRADAEAHWRTKFGPKDPYGVEHYAHPAYYVSIFSQFGVALRLLNSDVPDRPSTVIERLDEKFAELERGIEAFEREEHGENDVATELVRRARTELTRYAELVARWHASANAVERRVLAHDLQTTYDRTFWKFEGTRL